MLSTFGTVQMRSAAGPDSVADRSLTTELRRPARQERLDRLAEVAAGQESGVPRADVAQSGGDVRLALLVEHLLGALHHQRRVRGDLLGERAGRGKHRLL